MNALNSHQNYTAQALQLKDCRGIQSKALDKTMDTFHCKIMI